MKRRSGHLPQLNPLELEAALARLQQTNLSPAGKALIASQLRAAANPNAEAPEVVIKSLAKERRADVETTQLNLGGMTARITSRGGAALLALSDAEWDALVNEANDDQ